MTDINKFCIESISIPNSLVDVLKGSGEIHIQNPWFHPNGIPIESSNDYLKYKSIGNGVKTGHQLKSPKIYFKVNEHWITNSFIKMSSNPQQFSMRIFKPFSNDFSNPITTPVNKLSCSCGSVTKNYNQQWCKVDMMLCQTLELILYMRLLNITPNDNDNDSSLLESIKNKLNDKITNQDDIDLYLSNIESNDIFKLVREKGETVQQPSDEVHDLSLLFKDSTMNLFKSIKRGKINSNDYNSDIYNYFKSSDLFIKPIFVCNRITFKEPEGLKTVDIVNTKIKFTIRCDDEKRFDYNQIYVKDSKTGRYILRDLIPSDLKLDDQTQPKLHGSFYVKYDFDLRTYKVGIVNGTTVRVSQIKLEDGIQSRKVESLFSEDENEFDDVENEFDENIITDE